MCLAVVCVEAGFSQIWSHMASNPIICHMNPINMQFCAKMTSVPEISESLYPIPSKTKYSSLATQNQIKGVDYAGVLILNCLINRFHCISIHRLK